jgi:hypothetical protein
MRKLCEATGIASYAGRAIRLEFVFTSAGLEIVATLRPDNVKNDIDPVRDHVRMRLISTE